METETPIEVKTELNLWNRICSFFRRHTLPCPKIPPTISDHKASQPPPTKNKVPWQHPNTITREALQSAQYRELMEDWRSSSQKWTQDRYLLVSEQEGSHTDILVISDRWSADISYALRAEIILAALHVFKDDTYFDTARYIVGLTYQEAARCGIRIVDPLSPLTTRNR